MEGLAHLFAQHQVVVVHGVIGNGPELGNIHLAAVAQDGFIGGNIDDLAHQAAGFRIIGDDLALQCHGKLVDEGRVHKFGFDSMEAGFGELIRLLIAADDAHIVAGGYPFCGGHGHGEGLPGDQILGGLVGGVHADGDLPILADAAPGGVHGIGGAVGVVGADDVDRHRVTHGLEHQKSLSTALMRRRLPVAPERCTR